MATHWRALLEARAEELRGLERMSEAARAPVGLDQQSVGRLSRMDAMQQQAMSQAEGARRRRDLGRIEAALTRLEEGEFGYCLTCGDEIAERRLMLDPAAATCIGCAR